MFRGGLLIFVDFSVGLRDLFTSFFHRSCEVCHPKKLLVEVLDGVVCNFHMRCAEQTAYCFKIGWKKCSHTSWCYRDHYHEKQKEGGYWFDKAECLFGRFITIV